MSAAWKNVIDSARRESTRPPPGGMTMDQLCEQHGLSETNMRRIVQKLIASGRAERLPGKMMTTAGTIVSCNYYRLTAPAKGKKK